MTIPEDLQQSINKLFEKIDLQQLKRGSALLSKRYLEGQSLISKQELLSYLIVRFPATYAAIHAVFSQISQPGSLLDLGAGPGTASWAAQSLWGESPVTAVEREPFFVSLGRQLGAPAQWIEQDLHTMRDIEKHDWALFSYSYGELAPKRRLELLEQIWSLSNQGIILIEPGTPRGYHSILEAREYLIQLGGAILAPCPHKKGCPLPPDDWCHFSVRMERSFLHRWAKEAALPYEDEKYSYLIAVKNAPLAFPSRILRPPQHRSGHTRLPLCTQTGLCETIVTRKDHENYKKARKALWGDSW